MANPKSIAMASSISVVVCEHGKTTLCLMDAAGNVFATASMTTMEALQLSEQIIDGIQNWRDGNATSCGGHA